MNEQQSARPRPTSVCRSLIRRSFRLTTPSTAGAELAELFGIKPEDEVLRRRYESTDKQTGRLLSASVSYMPKALVEGNPELLDQNNEPWWGGTQHQLSTVGVEIMCIVDQVTAQDADNS